MIQQLESALNILLALMLYSARREGSRFCLPVCPSEYEERYTLDQVTQPLTPVSGGTCNSVSIQRHQKLYAVRTRYSVLHLEYMERRYSPAWRWGALLVRC
jgi:hypothetical protein